MSCRHSSEQATMEWLVFLDLLIRLCMAAGSFSPNIGDQDAYGIKIAGNSGLFVQANSWDRTFLTVIFPYFTTDPEFRCSFTYGDPADYIYTVGFGSKQGFGNPGFFYYAGERVPTDVKGVDGTRYDTAFIAVMSNPYG